MRFFLSFKVWFQNRRAKWRKKERLPEGEERLYGNTRARTSYSINEAIAEIRGSYSHSSEATSRFQSISPYSPFSKNSCLATNCTCCHHNEPPLGGTQQRSSILGSSDDSLFLKSNFSHERIRKRSVSPPSLISHQSNIPYINRRINYSEIRNGSLYHCDPLLINGYNKNY